MFITVMRGQENIYITEYKTKKQAEKAAENIRLLGYEVKVKQKEC